MLTPAEIEERHRIQDEERRLERIAGRDVCAECGAGLRTPWNPDKGCLELVCSKDRNHIGHVWVDPELDRLYRWRKGIVERGESTEAIDAEIQQLQIHQQKRKGAKHMVEEKALAEYKEKGLIAQDRAMDIIRATPGWGKAPITVVKRAAMICSDYRLFPGIHVFLIAFNEGKPNETWAVVMGIKTNRLLASRRKPYEYTDGPRIATEEEAKAHFKEECDPNLIYAVCRGKGMDGSAAEGWGTWPKSQTPYGIDKGNSKANMAEIRAERRFLDRLCPGEMPTGVELIDESFIAPGETPTIREIDRETGEIIEGEKVAPLEPEEAAKAEEEKAESAAPPSAKGKQESRMIEKDPTEFTPKTQADLVGGASYYFEKKSNEVATLLGGSLPATEEAIADAWQVVLDAWGKGGANG